MRLHIAEYKRFIRTAEAQRAQSKTIMDKNELSKLILGTAMEVFSI